MSRRLIALALAGVLACASAPAAASADDSAAALEVTHYKITSRYSTSSEGHGSSGSSNGRSAYREEVRADVAGCRTRIFDLIDDPERKRPLVEWQMPIVLRECPGATPVLANRDDMLARRDAFLAAIKVTTEACGRYYFTWSVFQIECDPDAAVEGILKSDLSLIPLEDGADYRLPDTGTGVTLVLASDTPPGQRVFTGTAAIDPAYLRDSAADTIMVVAEVSGKTVTREEALAQIASHQFSGKSTITVVEEAAADRITTTITGVVREVDAEGEVATRQGEVVTIRQRVEAASGSDPSQFSDD
ncbi:hypothetical protein [Porphyrobacter sp. ULC335]|uniref:hypothetical protein n=1 Tax=Porphyrobacter sp. ULC335 TaxID=2854260 RepID=UPI00221E9644|nr:hypothetical protein [Porphyrobacter sp. ULC335]UYV15602.1 hypothetical protein KVF90_16150 [Porphyrobacter sp. ULC335]